MEETREQYSKRETRRVAFETKQKLEVLTGSGYICQEYLTPAERQILQAPIPFLESIYRRLEGP